jgi:hypothetical protein
VRFLLLMTDLHEQLLIADSTSSSWLFNALPIFASDSPVVGFGSFKKWYVLS